MSVPKDIRESSKQLILFGDDILCTKQFNNIDSTSYIDISIYKDTSKRSLDKFMNGQIDMLKHLYGNLVILNKEVINQSGNDMLSITVELPLTANILAVLLSKECFTHKKEELL